MDLGVCQFCGLPVPLRSSFVNTGPADMNDPAKPRSEKFVPVDEDIHGWSPWVVSHPCCYASERGVEALVALVDKSHRFMRESARAGGFS
jgi:hypothetical protein